MLKAVLEEGPEKNSSSTISCTTLSLRENTLQSRGDPQRQGVATRPREEAVPNVTRVEEERGGKEDGGEGEQKRTSIGTTASGIPKEKSFSNPLRERPTGNSTLQAESQRLKTEPL